MLPSGPGYDFGGCQLSNPLVCRCLPTSTHRHCECAKVYNGVTFSSSPSSRNHREMLVEINPNDTASITTTTKHPSCYTNQ